MIQQAEYLDDVLLDTKEVANLLSIKPDTLYHAHLRNTYPELQRNKKRIGKKIYYKLSAVLALISD